MTETIDNKIDQAKVCCPNCNRCAIDNSKTNLAGSKLVICAFIVFILPFIFALMCAYVVNNFYKAENIFATLIAVIIGLIIGILIAKILTNIIIKFAANDG